MAEQKRKPGRPLKHVGLSTPAALKQVVNGTDVRDLRAGDTAPDREVLPEARHPDPPQAGPRRLFGTADDDHGVRAAPAIKPAVLDAPGRAGSEPVTFTDLLKKIALEIAPNEFAKADELGITNMELLARKVFYAALSENMGAQRARELVIERLEGKAGRATPVQGTNTELDDQLDRAAVALLNDLVPSTEPTDA